MAMEKSNPFKTKSFIIFSTERQLVMLLIRHETFILQRSYNGILKIQNTFFSVMLLYARNFEQY